MIERVEGRFSVILPNKKCKSWLRLAGVEQTQIGSSAVGLEILSARLRIKSEAAVEEGVAWQMRMGWVVEGVYR